MRGRARPRTEAPREAGAVDGSGVVHDEHRRLPRRAPPRRAADLQRGAEHRRRCSPRCGPPCPTPRSSSSTTAAPTAPPSSPRSSARSSEQIGVLRRPEKAGLGSAYRAGFRVGLDRGLDVMVEMDSDLSHDPAALPSLLAAIDDGADLVIGSAGTSPVAPSRTGACTDGFSHGGATGTRPRC